MCFDTNQICLFIHRSYGCLCLLNWNSFILPLMWSVIRIPQNCFQSLHLLAHDPDGDVVRCKSDMSNDHPNVHLDEVLLSNDKKNSDALHLCNIYNIYKIYNVRQKRTLQGCFLYICWHHWLTLFILIVCRTRALFTELLHWMWVCMCSSSCWRIILFQK